MGEILSGTLKPRIRVGPSDIFNEVQSTLQRLNLITVCEEGSCPNLRECWGRKTATFMLLGDFCTRACRFCHVKTTSTGCFPDEEEIHKISKAVQQWGLDYVVLTSVTRDDLADFGAGHLAASIKSLKALDVGVEIIIPDFQCSEDCLKLIVNEGPNVLAHNMETVKRLQPVVRDRRATYKNSLNVLKKIKELNPHQITKSSLMLGLGENRNEIIETLHDLRQMHVDIITVGQYLRPTESHLAVKKSYSLDEFRSIKEEAEKVGFLHVSAGPFVRSSYKAGESYKCVLKNKHCRGS